MTLQSHSTINWLQWHFWRLTNNLCPTLLFTEPQSPHSHSLHMIRSGLGTVGHTFEWFALLSALSHIGPPIDPGTWTQEDDLSNNDVPKLLCNNWWGQTACVWWGGGHTALAQRWWCVHTLQGRQGAWEHLHGQWRQCATQPLQWITTCPSTTRQSTGYRAHPHDKVATWPGHSDMDMNVQPYSPHTATTITMHLRAPMQLMALTCSPTPTPVLYL